jgi:hypothetical protein
MVLVGARTADASGGAAAILFDGRVIDVRELTGVDGQAQETECQKIFRLFPPDKFDPLENAFMEPATEPLDEQSPVIETYYQHQVNGALELFLRGQVFSLYQRLYPKDDVSKYLKDDVAIDNAIAQSAHVSASYCTGVADALTTHRDPESFAEAMVGVLPTSALKRSDWIAALRECVPDSPYLVIQAKCFPVEVAGIPAPWYRAEMLAGTLRYHVMVHAEQDHKRFEALVDDRLGQRYALFIATPNPVSATSLERLARSVLDEKGEPSRMRVEKANAALTAVDSGVRVNVYFGARPNFAAMFGISAMDQGVAKLIEVSKAGNHPHGFFFVAPSAPKPALQSYPITPGNFMFDAACDDLLRPLVRETLRKLEAKPPWKPPSENDLFSRLLAADFVAYGHGVRLASPKVTP